jgi:glucose-1-phosphate cytidylyltransferase
MKVVILCGGKGTRMGKETEFRPKPLILIGGKPILWHIMKFYSSYGYNDFILCIGYKGDMIKQYFIEMYWRNNDFTLHMDGNNSIEYKTHENENWNITIVDTGLETMTGGRIKKVEKYIDEDEFMFTYGDGLSNINLKALVEYHRKKNKIATLTGVHPTSSFGLMNVENGIVKAFREKPILNDMVNGGYMVMNKKVFDYFPQGDCAFEEEPLVGLAKDGQLTVYEHQGFWKAIDTQKDIIFVDNMCNKGIMPWLISS